MDNANQQSVLNHELRNSENLKSTLGIKRMEQAEEGLNIKKNAIMKCINELKKKREDLNTDLQS